ncbi:MAG: TRAP transporter small permease subunit [Dehalococcoidia bacterium]|nr:MAG: TRAP transporter small permease subunit [Dehalococcoidia bacterium]
MIDQKAKLLNLCRKIYWVNIMGKAGRFVDKLIAHMSYLGISMGVVILSILVGIITINVILRYAFNNPVTGVDEIGKYLLIAMVFMGLAYNARIRANITVELGVRFLSKRARDGLEVVTSLATLILIYYYVRYSFHLFMISVQANARSTSSLATPLWIPHVVIWVGILFAGFEILVNIVKKLREFQRGSKVAVYEKKLETTY